MIGASTTQWGSFSLPLHLDILGAAGCYIRTDPTATLDVFTSAGGAASRSVTIPINNALISQRFHTQYLVVDVGANPGNLVTTRGITTLVGGQN
jgi:hypothetical protein